MISQLHKQASLPPLKEPWYTLNRLLGWLKSPSGLPTGNRTTISRSSIHVRRLVPLVTRLPELTLDYLDIAKNRTTSATNSPVQRGATNTLYRLKILISMFLFVSTNRVVGVKNKWGRGSLMFEGSVHVNIEKPIR